MCITIYYFIGIILVFFLSIFIAYKIGYKGGHRWGRDEGWMEGANKEYMENLEKRKKGE